MKKAKPGALARLQHIRDAILLAFDFTEGFDKTAFLNDPKTQAAVVRQIEIIGEAVYALPDTLTQQYPHIPWKNIEATRHKIVHDYFEVDLEVVWNVTRIHLPPFLKEIEGMIANFQ